MKAMYIFDKGLSLKKMKRIVKKNYKKCESIVIGNNLKNNLELMKFINSLNIPICNGRWLFKYLVIQILEYIEIIQQKRINEQRIVLITDNYNELVEFYIRYLANKVKNLKIITDKSKKFKMLEEELYNEDGTVIAISQNRRKALQNIDIIINFDYNQEKINEFNIEEKAIIVNLKEKIAINTKRFKGININFYDITFENRYLKLLDWIKEFNTPELYESYVYEHTSVYDIENKLIRNHVKITKLIGNNGTVSEKEYKNVLDKTSYLS